MTALQMNADFSMNCKEAGIFVEKEGKEGRYFGSRYPETRDI